MVQQKSPPVRPRSSLSTDGADYRFSLNHSGRKRATNTVVSLLGLCLFFAVLCLCLLAALVFVGRSLVSPKTNDGRVSNLTADTASFVIKSKLENCEELLRDLKPNLILRHKQVAGELTAENPNVVTNRMRTGIKAVLAEIMKTSKILNDIAFRLPKEIRPKNYDLYLHPDLETKTFSGNITINLKVVKPISYIPVHAKKLNVTTEGFFRVLENGEQTAEIKPNLTFEHAEFEFWVSEFADPLDIGNYTLKLSFNGSLTDRIVGLYQSSYFDKTKNETRWIATSKFEPTYARQAFPCFDEPDMKAPFKITVVRPSGSDYSALSNMNQLSERPIGNGKTEVVFAESVPMSTYLACFIVSDFEHKSKEINANGIGKNFDMRVFATPEQLNKVDYALSVGSGVTEYYISYFNIEYPLPKLDMAAIPDFVSGAMEHWGLVTFRETALLYDENISASSNKQRVATVVAHELAHMWFGNLVTMKWWNDLWLNEGFATYIEYKGVNKVHPEWKMLDQFIIDDLHGVLKLDATLASHPIVQTVESPDQITELFDTITYSKGASIIRMLEGFVGQDKFQLAVHNYLDKYKLENAETDDFLTEVDALTDDDVKLVMRSWTEQMGLPVIVVSKDPESSTYRLLQKRFLSNPEDYEKEFEPSPFNYRWSVPITYFDNKNTEVQSKWFNYNDAEASLTFDSDIKWFKINKNQVGYYRVNYPVEMWKSLTEALVEDVNVLDSADRANLLNDAFALADATQLSYDIALDLTRYLAKELEYVPWSVAASKLLSLKNLLYYSEIFKPYVEYARNSVDQAYKRVTWTVGTDHLDNLLRVTILNTACSLGHVDAVSSVSEKFNEWIGSPENRPKPDIRQTIYYYGMMYAGNEENWDKMWTVFKDETDAQEKAKLMKGLAGIKEPWILQRFINLAWDETNVRGQDYFSCLQNIAANPIGRPIVWDFVRDNWEKLVERFGLNERYLGRMIPSITSTFATNIKLEEMVTFFEKYPDAGAGTSARKQALENVKNNIKWMEENSEKVGNWLEGLKK